MCLALLFASIWLLAGFHRAPKPSECPKECACSGEFRSCFYSASPQQLKADAALAQIPVLTLQNLGSIRFGNGTGQDRLDRGYAVAVDTLGRIHAIDVASHTMHVFDDTGRPLWLGSYSKHFGRERYPALMIKVTSSGDTWVELEVDVKPGYRDMSLLGPKYVHFGPSGKFLGVEQIRFEGDTWWHWLPQPDGGLRWLINHKKILLVDAHDAVLRSITWPNGEDFEDTSAVAQDGSLAVVMERPRKNFHRMPTLKPPELVAAIFSPHGDAVSEWPLPFHPNSYPRIAFDDRHLAFVVLDNIESGHQAILVTDARGKGLFRIPISADASIGKVFLLSRPSGEELWVWSDKVIDRYAMPK